MNVYTLQPGVIRPTQAIRDALNLPAHTSHVRWLIAAPNHNQAVYQLRGRGWSDMPTTQTGIELARGRDVTALVGAGLLGEASVLVTPDNWVGSGPVAVVERGGVPRQIGTLNRDLDGVRYTPAATEADPTAALRAAILAKLDEWANADDPGEVFDATERMHNALRAVVVGPDWGDLTPSYLPQPWANETIAAALGVDINGQTHWCSNCGGIDPVSCLFNVKEANRD